MVLCWEETKTPDMNPFLLDVKHHNNIHQISKLSPWYIFWYIFCRIIDGHKVGTNSRQTLGSLVFHLVKFWMSTKKSTKKRANRLISLTRVFPLAQFDQNIFFLLKFTKIQQTFSWQRRNRPPMKASAQYRKITDEWTYYRVEWMEGCQGSTDRSGQILSPKFSGHCLQTETSW